MQLPKGGGGGEGSSGISLFMSLWALYAREKREGYKRLKEKEAGSDTI